LLDVRAEFHVSSLVKYPSLSSGFDYNWHTSTKFCKLLNIEAHENPHGSSAGVTCRQTDIKKLTGWLLQLVTVDAINEQTYHKLFP
jgi:hypothetical protein